MLFVVSAWAVTLKEVVERAAEVSPTALVSSLESRVAGLEAAEAWAGLGLTPSFSYSTTFPVGSSTFSLSAILGVLELSNWMDAFQQQAQAGGARALEQATILDAQYAAAYLFYDLVGAQAQSEASEASVKAAKASYDAVSARVSAGLLSELDGRSAELALLSAEAQVEASRAKENIARARLERALEQEVGRAEKPELRALIDGESPYLEVASRSVEAARWAHRETVAELFPSGFLRSDYNTVAQSWSVTVGVAWSFDGLVGPFLRERASNLETQIVQVQYEALQLDLALGLTEAREEVRAAQALLQAALRREELSNESLQVAHARLSAGLASTLELLRIQDEAAKARSDRVLAENSLDRAILKTQHLSGQSW
jgi:outer membrane protein TolC